MSRPESGREAAARLRERNPTEAEHICRAVEEIIARLKGEHPVRVGYEPVGSDPWYERTVGR